MTEMEHGGQGEAQLWPTSTQEGSPPTGLSSLYWFWSLAGSIKPPTTGLEFRSQARATVLYRPSGRSQASRSKGRLGVSPGAAGFQALSSGLLGVVGMAVMEMDLNRLACISLTPAVPSSGCQPHL